MDGKWFQDNLRLIGRTQADLARHLRLDAAAITRLFKGERQMKLVEASRIAQFLNQPYEEVVRRAGMDDSGLHLPQLPPLADMPMAGARPAGFGQRDMPILGRAQGGPEGVILIAGDERPIDWTWRPPELAGVGAAYAVYVDGSSMEPRYFAGDTVWISPSIPLKPGKDVIVIKNNDESYIKVFIKRTDTAVVLAQYNPAKQITLPRTDIRSIHRVVGSWDGR